MRYQSPTNRRRVATAAAMLSESLSVASDITVNISSDSPTASGIRPPRIVLREVCTIREVA
jgi:shikimate kinase